MLDKQQDAPVHDTAPVHETASTFLEKGTERNESDKVVEVEEGLQKEQIDVMDTPTNSREENLFISHTGDSSISRIHTTPVGIVIADSEAEQVLHLLVKKKQSFQKKVIPNHNGSCRTKIYPPPGPDPDLGLEVGQNKVSSTIPNNKLPLFTMRGIHYAHGRSRKPSGASVTAGANVLEEEIKNKMGQ
ncbi:hypothetical protein IFM89_015328 [Coptis chinensis]|uniref:Uncharacterized protein n=1 Tax=Coptis chinensis TaxID=261450 RepID=A0A835ING8_9MAGN|nr:hypothetical protein IFM89_015328 [Coptis chinensis]